MTDAHARLDSSASVPLPARLVLVRHAESARQVAKGGAPFYPSEDARRTIEGIPDHLIPLTDKGREQAQLAGARLRTTFGQFDLAYHSGYLRARDTLTGILDAYTRAERDLLEVREDLLLRERDDGYGHDMTEAEAAAAFPWLQAYWQATGRLLARPPGGESLADVTLRAHQFLTRLAHDSAGRKVLIVAHGGSIRCLRSLIEGWSLEEMERQLRDEPSPNCAVTCYERADVRGGLVVRLSNTVLTSGDQTESSSSSP